MTKTKQESIKDVAIQPLFDKVLVLPDAIEEKKTASGIVVPTAIQNLSGVVVASGPGKFENGVFTATTLVFGDHVILGQYGHEEIVYDGKKYYIAPESTLLAIIN